MATPKLPKAQVDMFADLFTFGTEHGTLHDLQILLNLMGEMYPDLAQITAAQADIYLRTGNLGEARRLLTESEKRHPANPLMKAMMAYCLLVQGDVLWESYARETMALPEDPAAKAIIAALSALKGTAIEGVSMGDGGSSSSSMHMPPMGMAC